MKKILIITFLAVLATTTMAQPRAAGLRLGGTGLEASYQHTIGKNFIEAELGMDFGHPSIPEVGFRAGAMYNFVLANPAWTEKGKWGIYAGPGLSLGYVNDRVTYSMVTPEGKKYRYHPAEYGFMFSLSGQIGLEYTFWFPLQISVDIRPYIGFHVNDGKVRYGNKVVTTGASKVGFYESGMMGFVPSVSFRYRF